MKLIGPFKQLLTMNGLPIRGALSDNQLEVIPNGGILISDRKILAVGNFNQLKDSYKPSEVEQLNTSYVALPGLIDAHTHICWAGSRANDFALRLSEKSYLEIADQGGGIWDTVQKTRVASLEELAISTAFRANQMLKQGVTTIEVKSGYGLSVDQELKILEAIKKANDETSAELIPTCLAAHILPKDFPGSETDYLEYILQKLLPKVLEKKLSKRVDIFVDKGAFSISAARDYLLKAKAMGFELAIHGDQFSTGVASLATEVGALSIDHLEAADEMEITILSKGSTIPVALPGASIGLGEPFAPARKMLDAGTSLAIASDWNPGSAPMGNLLVEAAILGTKEKLTMTEIWVALTFRAADALNLTNRGVLKSGNLADIIAFKTDNYKEILYHQGQLQPQRVWKNGYCVVNNNKNQHQ
jgi:imidazolonepropionase